MKAPQAPETAGLRDRNGELRRLVMSGEIEQLGADERRRLLGQHVNQVEALLDTYDRLDAMGEETRRQAAAQAALLDHLQQEQAALRVQLGIHHAPVH